MDALGPNIDTPGQSNDIFFFSLKNYYPGKKKYFFLKKY